MDGYRRIPKDQYQITNNPKSSVASVNHHAKPKKTKRMELSKKMLGIRLKMARLNI